MAGVLDGYRPIVIELKALIATVTSTLAETQEHWMPASCLYTMLDMDMSKYKLVSAMLEDLGLVKVGPERIRLTDKGLEIGRQCSKFFQDRAAEN